jgi:hypothetical protein
MEQENIIFSQSDITWTQNHHINESTTVKPRFKGPAFQVFPYLRYIFGGPNQSTIYLMYYFSRFKDLPVF